MDHDEDGSVFTDVVDEPTERELALSMALQLNMKRGEIIAPFPTGTDVVVDAEAFLRFLQGQEPAQVNAPGVTGSEA